MASIAGIIEDVKSMIHSPEDVEEVFRQLGPKEELLASSRINSLPNDGKVHVFPFEIEGYDRTTIGHTYSEVWVRLSMYNHTYPRIEEIVNDTEDHASYYDSMMKRRGKTYYDIMNPNKPPHPPLSVEEWQSFAKYDDSMYKHEYTEDDSGECPWTHSGDHKDPEYVAYAKVTVHLYFRRSTPEDFIKMYELNPKGIHHIFFGEEGCFLTDDHKITKSSSGKLSLESITDDDDVIALDVLMDVYMPMMVVHKNDM